MTDLRQQIQSHLDSPKLRENLGALFTQTLNWGRLQGAPRPIAAPGPDGRPLAPQPIAQLGGLQVFRADWRDVRLPTLSQRRDVHHLMTPIVFEHMMCYVTEDSQQAAFVWARRGARNTVEMRSLQFDRESGARTTVDQLVQLAFTFDELKEGEPSIDTVTDRVNAAFDIEAVTNRFFKEFRDVFEDTKAALSKSIRNAADRHAFTQRLLNRLLFLCFLQKKHWLKSPDLAHPSTNYLFELFDYAKAQDRNFYTDYLHDLFFNALNRPRVGRSDSDRDRLWNKLGVVPFLNGGLFDPTDAYDEPGKVALPNKLFEPILGDYGLLRHYNFTVTEATPLSQEVAVDPEMLGKVFETVVLTSEEAEDYQAPNLRKATGSYYTPRIVVNFIVREVLKDYLIARVPGLDKGRLGQLMEIDALGGLSEDTIGQLLKFVTQQEAKAIRAQLDSLRACDPAIGSGAFALGLLHQLVNLRLLCETTLRGKDPRFEDRNLVFEYKKHSIEHNIYGVDLQAKAVEICKLRLWLSLIVDYELSVDPLKADPDTFEEAVQHIPALPNLAYKIRRGDALLDLVHDRPFRLKDIQYSEAMQDARAELERVHREFYGAQEPHHKRRLRLEALIHRTRLTRLQLESQKQEMVNTGPQIGMFDQKESKATIRKRGQALAALDAVLAEVKATEDALQPLIRRKNQLAQADDDTLTELEATSEGDEITFTWELDFPEIFATPRPEPQTLTGKMSALVNQTPGQMELSAPETIRGGFDIIVGNPPFVTARNPEKRELYRERWKETAFKEFQLVAPFFQRSFGLLRPNGHLGFIVSNAFAKREFGRPLVEDFFPKVEIQKVVDCSGLMFPGHGTPTCIVIGRIPSPLALPTRGDIRERGASYGQIVRVAATLPGGGDLRTTPEESPLWAALQAHHDHAGYSDARIIVADRLRDNMAKWPWNFDSGAEPVRLIIERSTVHLLELLTDRIGYACITKGDEVYFQPQHFVRRLSPAASYVLPLSTGDSIRDWVRDDDLALFPYDSLTLRVAKLKDLPYTDFLKSLVDPLSARITFGKPQSERGAWYEYAMMSPDRLNRSYLISIPEIATHNHALVLTKPFLASQTAPVASPKSPAAHDHHLLAGLLNSSAALFWLKLVCFNKGAGDEEERDRFVYAGGKVEQLPVPSAILTPSSLRDRLTALSRACWEHGQQLPGLAFKKLFEMDGEAYWEWNTSLAGWVAPSPSLPRTRGRGKVGIEFRTANELSSLREAALAERARLRAEMIALQEEMDWLVYAAYGLLPIDHPAVGNVQPEGIEPLQLGERPFELLRDNLPIPEHFSTKRRALWQARLKAIQENEHARRIEQPVYKRRWYRKVSDEQEFRRAFEWWLLEKAERWLENKAKGGPVNLDRWAAALWEDERVRAASQVAAPDEIGRFVQIPLMEKGAAAPREFAKLFKSVVAESTVPDWIPPAMPWEQVEKKFKTAVPARARKIRGKLNIPRERFWLTEDGEYVWAGKK